jgi:hypothetical protein
VIYCAGREGKKKRREVKREGKRSKKRREREKIEKRWRYR